MKNEENLTTDKPEMDTDQKTDKQNGEQTKKGTDEQAEDQSKIQNLKSKISVGCQGWNYDDWTTKAGDESIFYPRGTRSAEMLALYAEIFSTVEIDSTFYAIPTAATIESWYQKTPADFTFSLKMPQSVTHEHALRPSSFPIIDEFSERIRELREKLAVVLIQLPPNFAVGHENAQNFRDFLAWLPQDICFAVEFRERQWLVDWTFEELEKANVALCLVEGGWIPRELMFEAVERMRGRVAYVRLMGERDLTSFDKIYREESANLQIWKEEIQRIKAEDIYVYFSNFYEGHAPASANKLKKMLGQKIIEASALENQGSLF